MTYPKQDRRIVIDTQLTLTQALKRQKEGIYQQGAPLGSMYIYIKLRGRPPIGNAIVMILVPTFDNLALLGTLLVPSGTCWLHFGRPSVTGASHCTLFCTIWGTGGAHRPKGRRNSPPTVSIHAIWLIQGFTFLTYFSSIFDNFCGPRRFC